MSFMKKYLLVTIVLLASLINVSAQGPVNIGLKPIVIEAESGVLGSNFNILTSAGITYITTTVDYSGQSYPESDNSVATYQVTFETPGSYHLFVRVRVGSGSYSDDSFFGAKGFGEKELSNADEWVMINGIASAGFNGKNDVVLEAGAVGSNEWKWINISNNYFVNITDPFVVTDQLTQTFQIGTREDGLDFDKIAFGKTNLFYTVEVLDKVLDGLTEMPVDSSLYQGPPIAQGTPKFLGNVKDRGDDNFSNIWNQLTPGNEGKWASVGGNKDTLKWNWGGLDNLYDYAKSNGMLFKNHTLIWGGQQPSWINDFGPTDQLQYIETWMRQVGQRYPEMDMIDVVNEAIATHNPPDGKNDRANYKEALGGDGASGYDWIVTSFQLARKYMPEHTKLILNDYGIINDNNSTTIYLQIINLLIEKGLIDGIGVQCHRFEIQNTGLSTLKNNLDRLAETGLPIYISEMDLGDNDDDAPYDDDLQLKKYKEIFPIFWEHPSVHGITLWGSLEGKMWQKTCHVINSDNSWRPALTWMAQYIKDTHVEISVPRDNTPLEVKSVYHEAECADAGENWVVYSDSEASNGNYLTAKGALESKSIAPEGSENLIVVPFVTDTNYLYKIYGRVNCPSTNNDSFWLIVDGKVKKASGLKTKGWEWKLLGSFDLSKGEHTLSIGYCENGALLDKICISNSLFPPTEMGEVAVNKCDTTGIKSSVVILSNNSLVQNYPNPFSNNTTIEFKTSTEQLVSLKVYDVLGNLVATLVNGTLQAGEHKINWNATSNNQLKVRSGTYIYQLVNAEQVFSGKMILINQ